MVTTPKDQRDCGCCYAFAACCSMESKIMTTQFINTNLMTNIDLSEQSFVDCTNNTLYGNLGCNGGITNKVYQHVIDNKGANGEKTYPYRAVVLTEDF
jgi:C1A family cysteine protease